MAIGDRDRRRPLGILLERGLRAGGRRRRSRARSATARCNARSGSSSWRGTSTASSAAASATPSRLRERRTRQVVCVLFVQPLISDEVSRRSPRCRPLPDRHEREPPMLKLGYKASAEQFAPRGAARVRGPRRSRGLRLVMVSDHFQPWRHTGGHAPFSFAWLAALGERTDARADRHQRRDPDLPLPPRDRRPGDRARSARSTRAASCSGSAPASR